MNAKTYLVTETKADGYDIYEYRAAVDATFGGGFDVSPTFTIHATPTEAFVIHKSVSSGLRAMSLSHAMAFVTAALGFPELIFSQS